MDIMMWDLVMGNGHKITEKKHLCRGDFAGRRDNDMGLISAFQNQSAVSGMQLLLLQEMLVTRHGSLPSG
jgi:hypothetical protein